MSRHRLYFKNGSDEDVKNLSDSSLSTNEKQARSIIPKLINNKLNPEASDSDFDSDSNEYNEFFFGLNRKLPYTMEEDEVILKFVLKGRNIFKSTSISLWKHLESKKEKPIRTYQSLKNRFLRNIKPNIFTTYKHLVENEEMAKKILLKFPELSKSHARSKRSLNIAPRKTDFLEMQNKNSEVVKNPIVEITEPINNHIKSTKRQIISNQVSNENTESVLKPSCSKVSVPLRSTVAQTLHVTANRNLKEINLDNDKIIITFQNNCVKETANHNTLKIYEKYLKMKFQNDISKCRYCGQSDFEVNVVEANNLQNENSNQNVQNEDDVIVIGSYKPQEAENLVFKKEITLKMEKVSQNLRSFQKQKEKFDENDSPSLLKDVSVLEEKSPSSSKNWKENELNGSLASSEKRNHSTQYVSGYFPRKESSKENVVEPVMNHDSRHDLEMLDDLYVNKKRRKLCEVSDDDEYTDHTLNQSKPKENCDQTSDLEISNVEIPQFANNNCKNSLLDNMFKMSKSDGVKFKKKLLENGEKINF